MIDMGLWHLASSTVLHTLTYAQAFEGIDQAVGGIHRRIRKIACTRQMQSTIR
jgi:hypothetical protein